MTTLTEDRLAASSLPSSLTTVPRWHPSRPRARSNDPHFLRSSSGSRGELRVYVEGANLPWWFDDYLNTELNRLFALPTGWDGFSADEVTIEAVRETVTVLAVIVNEASPAPQFFPLLDGGIQVEWHVGGDYTEIEVNGAGEAYILATRSNGETVADGEVRAGQDAPRIELVKTFLNELSTRLSLAN